LERDRKAASSEPENRSDERDEERVSLFPLDPEDVLRALLQTPPVRRDDRNPARTDRQKP
jgi:hypothetical protein